MNPLNILLASSLLATVLALLTLICSSQQKRLCSSLLAGYFCAYAVLTLYYYLQFDGELGRNQGSTDALFTWVVRICSYAIVVLLYLYVRNLLTWKDRLDIQDSYHLLPFGTYLFFSGMKSLPAQGPQLFTLGAGVIYLMTTFSLLINHKTSSERLKAGKKSAQVFRWLSALTGVFFLYWFASCLDFIAADLLTLAQARQFKIAYIGLVPFLTAGFLLWHTLKIKAGRLDQPLPISSKTIIQ